MKCKICGTRLGEGVTKCPACGAVVGDEANTVQSNVVDSAISKSFCPTCGKEILGEHAFCPYCGENLKEPENVEIQKAAGTSKKKSAPQKTQSKRKSTPRKKQNSVKSAQSQETNSEGIKDKRKKRNWTCGNCGTKNPGSENECSGCHLTKWQAKQKQKKREKKIGIFVYMYLCVSIITGVVITFRNLYMPLDDGIFEVVLLIFFGAVCGFLGGGGIGFLLAGIYAAVLYVIEKSTQSNNKNSKN